MKLSDHHCWGAFGGIQVTWCSLSCLTTVRPWKPFSSVVHYMQFVFLKTHLVTGIGPTQQRYFTKCGKKNIFHSNIIIPMILQSWCTNWCLKTRQFHVCYSNMYVVYKYCTCMDQWAIKHSFIHFTFLSLHQCLCWFTTSFYLLLCTLSLFWPVYF